jgi:CP family cyanate transporter-like MFS transporter
MNIDPTRPGAGTSNAAASHGAKAHAAHSRGTPPQAGRSHAVPPAAARPHAGRPANGRRWVLLLGILLIAASLRAPITAIGPLLHTVSVALHLGATEAGMLTTLPLLAFAAVSPFAALLAREYGLERALFGALAAIIAGIATRSAGATWTLYLGTAVAGSGIAVGNVLLPSLLKRDFPGSITTITAIYALVMGVAAAAGSALVVPIAHAHGLGWPFALAVLAVLPVAAGLAWLPQLRMHTAPAPDTARPPHGGPVWHSALAWQVTLYMGLTSFIYYVAIAWLPAMLAQMGYTPERAGSLHGLMQFASGAPGLLLLPLLPRLKDQRALAFVSPLLGAAGLLGLLYAPSFATLWIFLFGAGLGAALILSLSFVSLRASSPSQAATLSAMAQSLGYLMAAVGPALFGAVHDVTGNWSIALSLCAGLCVVMAVIGLGAGRSAQIGHAARHVDRTPAGAAVARRRD